MTKEQAYQKIKQLVERFEQQIASYKKADYNETQTRRDFIDPFFKALGWDVDNEQGFTQEYREVIHEDKIKVGKATKAPDYSFRLVGGTRLFFVEAKKPSVAVKDEILPAYQVRRYGWSAKLSISIITDFEEFAIYDCTKKPNEKDKASVARIKYITYKDYLNEFDFLWDTFSKENVPKGSLNQFIKGSANKKGTTTVDNEFLISLDNWRTQLAENIAKNNKQLDEDELNFVVQQTIDRLIFLRIAEDRSVEPYGQLKDTVNTGTFYNNLFQIFRQADEKYNSGIFDFQKDKLSKHLTLDNKVVKQIITELYYPVCPYEFSVLSVEILGTAYEQFLGKQITLSKTGKAVIELKPEVRKAGGVYYTPQYIVDYIVANTVGKLVANKTPKQVANIKITDPACGSGSFLIGAYHFLLNWHFQYYTSNPNEAKKDKAFTSVGTLSTQIKKQILLNNIHGVDIDVNAVEVTKLSLLLKCMEGETQASIASQMSLFNERVLPTLDNNIKSGNSLIDIDFYESQLDFGETKKVNPFSWQQAFPNVFKQGGFDCVIGNPPYVDYRIIPTEQVAYLNNKYNSTQTKEKWSLYLPFVELGTKILNDKGIYGNIIPNTFLSADFGKPLRKMLLTSTSILEITDVSTLKVFGNVGTYPILLFYENAYNKQSKINIANPTSPDQLNNLSFEKIKQADIIAKNQTYVISTSYTKDNFTLIAKLQASGVMLKTLVGKFSWGTSISGFKSYKIKESDYNKLSSVNKKQYKKVIQTADIKSYTINWQKEYIDTSIYSANVVEHFNQDKIVIARLTKTIQATFDTEQHYMGKSSFITNPKVDAKYLIALLNSYVLNYFFSIKFTNTHLAGGYLRFDIPYLEKLPIKVLNLKDKAQKEQHDNIVKFVTQIMSLKNELQTTTLQTKVSQIQNQITFYEDKINQTVYQLYNLTDDEIKAIEN